MITKKIIRFKVMGELFTRKSVKYKDMTILDITRAIKGGSAIEIKNGEKYIPHNMKWYKIEEVANNDND